MTGRITQQKLDDLFLEINSMSRNEKANLLILLFGSMERTMMRAKKKTEQVNARFFFKQLVVVKDEAKEVTRKLKLII